MSKNTAVTPAETPAGAAIPAPPHIAVFFSAVGLKGRGTIERLLQRHLHADDFAKIGFYEPCDAIALDGGDPA